MQRFRQIMKEVIYFRAILMRLLNMSIAINFENYDIDFCDVSNIKLPTSADILNVCIIYPLSLGRSEIG